MVPFVVIAENRRRLKQVFLFSIGAMAAAQLTFFVLLDSLWGIVVGLLIYFTAFNVLEATLPSLVAKVAPVESKGTGLRLSI